MNRPLAIFPLVLLQLLLGVGAVYGGWTLMTDPSVFELNPEWLAGSPFRSYFFPGLILFLLNGVFPLFICIGLLLKPAWPWANVFNIYRDRHWAWTYSLFSGIMLIIWITVQLTMMPSYWLQPAFLGVGILILIFTLWPAMMRYYQYAEK